MRKHKLIPVNFLHKERCESTYFDTQRKRVSTALHMEPKTMLMVSIKSGLLRANICRYVDKRSKQNRIRIKGKGICTVSKHLAGFYITKPELFPAIVEPSNTVKL